MAGGPAGRARLPSDQKGTSFSYQCSPHRCHSASLQAVWQQLSAMQENWIHPAQWGFRPAKSAAEAALKAALRQERAEALGHVHCVVDLDLSKAFDSIPRNLLWSILTNLGVPANILDPWKAWYGPAHVRRYKHLAGVGDKWSASNGLVQGCPLSCIAQNALMLSLVRAIDQLADTCPEVTVTHTMLTM